MRIVLDADKCQGHARCYALAPHLFEIDEYGQSSIVGDGVISQGDEERVALVIANCPELAIREIES